MDRMHIWIYVPKPGIRQLQMRQNQANETGSTGIAAFISDVWSTSDSSIFGRLSSGGRVGAMLCFLLFMLVRLLSTTSFFLQHIKRSQRRAQQLLRSHILIKRNTKQLLIKHFGETCNRNKCTTKKKSTPDHNNRALTDKRWTISATHFFGVSLITLSWRLSVQAIGSFAFLRHGMQKQQFRTSSSGSVVLWILFVLRQHRYFARHMVHLLRCFWLWLSSVVVASFIAVVASAASVVASCSIVVTSSMIFFCLLRLHHFNRFQQESAFVSVSFKIVATAAACFSPASKFCLPPRLLQHDNFFRRRHGKQSADA